MSDGEGASRLRAYIAERDIAWVRFAVIAFNVALYVFWLPHDPARHGLAVTVSIVASAYAFVVVTLRPYEHFPALRTSTYTVVTDSGLITVWLFATGGIASPFYALWLLSLLAVVFRFAPVVVGIAAGVYAAADLGMLAISGDLAGNLPQVASRIAYIFLVGALGMLLGHRWTTAVQERVRMTQEVGRREEKLREAERLRILSDAAFEGIVIHQDGRVLEANQAASRILGVPREDLLGRDIRLVVDAASAQDLNEQIASPDDERKEFWIRRNGERRRVASQGRDLEYQGERARVAAVRDITDEYAARRAHELAAAQQMEIERLQDADRFKTRFINTAAHELNTPMTPIKLQLHLLREELKHRPRSLDILERNLDRLARLVHDMLDVARLQSGRAKIRGRSVDISPVCDEVYETFLPTALKQSVYLERLLPDRMIAYADPERVVQIVTNLLSNALKFTTGGDRVTMLAHETSDAVRIEVIDTGKGLSEKDQQRLFQPFTQAHEDPNIPGTGLGLYICKNLAEAMGGRVGVASEGPGKGARFWLDLPRERPAEATDQGAEPGDARLPSADAPEADLTQLPAEPAEGSGEVPGTAGPGQRNAPERMQGQQDAPQGPREDQERLPGQPDARPDPSEARESMRGQRAGPERMPDQHDASEGQQREPPEAGRRDAQENAPPEVSPADRDKGRDPQHPADRGAAGT